MAFEIANLTTMRSVTEMRAVIDGFAARYAARRVRDGADAAPLLKVFAEMQRSATSGSYERFIAVDRKLHLAIVELAGVEGLVEVWLRCGDFQEKFRIGTLRECWPDLNVLFEGHRAMVDFICAGDASAAEDAAKAHLDAVWYRLAESRGDASLPDDPLERACAYLAFHLHEPTTLSFLAQHVARVSSGHLARLFRERWDASFTDYLRELRMKKAAQMLSDTRLPIHRIAQAVGYHDGSRFARHFRARFGKPPRAFRQRF